MTQVTTDVRRKVKSEKTYWLLTNEWRKHLHETDTNRMCQEPKQEHFYRFYFPHFVLDCFSIYRLFRLEVWNLFEAKKKNLILDVVELKEKHFHTCQQAHLIVLTHVFSLPAGAGISVSSLLEQHTIVHITWGGDEIFAQFFVFLLKIISNCRFSTVSVWWGETWETEGQQRHRSWIWIV